jgi:hypothetical protein
VFLFLAGLLGPSSDRRYGFGGGHRGSQGRGGGSWFMGYGFDTPQFEQRWWSERRGSGSWWW